MAGSGGGELRAPIFNGENYEFWSIRMKTIFKSHGLWELVEKGVECSDSKGAGESEEKKKEKEDSSGAGKTLTELFMKDARALGLIQGAVSEEIFPRISHEETSKGAWDLLMQEFHGDKQVNNAGVSGTIVDPESMRAAAAAGIGKDGVEVNWSEIMTQTYELAEVCVKTNYYGAKKMTKALLPLLQLSDSPRVVSLSSSMGSLKHIPSEWAKGMLSDAEKLTEQRIDDVLNEFLKDFKEDILETKGWPTSLSAYILSKAAVNAFTRMMANKYPNICINSVDPGFVKTDMNFNTGMLTIDEGAESVVRLAMVPNGSPSGLYFSLQQVSPF